MVKYNSVVKVIADKACKKLISVNLADEGASALIAGYVGGVLRKYISHELVNRVIALLQKRVVYCLHNVLKLIAACFGIRGV